MPQLPVRITSLNDGGSDGWELFYRARAMVARGVDVIELTIGEHDIGTDPSILNALHQAALGGHTGYAEVPGIAALRSHIANRVTKRSGAPTDTGNILITAGGQAALFAAHMAALSPGDAALYLDPYYATYPGTVRAAGGRAIAVPTNAQAGFAPDPEMIRAAAREHGARSLLINSPNNPTGTVYDRQSLEAIAQVCIEEDLWLISDEVYDTQIWEGAHLSARALPGMADRTLVIGSMSKSHAMTGSRIGWIVAPEPVIDVLINLATNTTYGVAGYIQDAALFALEQGPEFEAQIAKPFARRRARALDILKQHPDIHVIPSGGAMYLMLDIRATCLTGEAFAARLLEERRIAVMPGESFGSSAAGHIRLALTLDDERLCAALTSLCHFAESLIP